LPKIDEYLEEILKRDGSDLHFMAGDPPRIRQYGKLASLRVERLAAGYVREDEIMPRKRSTLRTSTAPTSRTRSRSRFRVHVLRS
jgi:twitching motility protein PilT